jgi:hypothetical protein
VSRIVGTNHEQLNRLDERGILFITLRIRSPKLLAGVRDLPACAWRTVNLDVFNRKHRTPKGYEQKVRLLEQYFPAVLQHGSRSRPDAGYCTVWSHSPVRACAGCMPSDCVITPTGIWSSRSQLETPLHRASIHACKLFLSVLLDVGLHCFLGMAAGMNGVAGRGMGMVRRRFVFPGLMVLGGFNMVAGRMSQML